MRLLYKYGVMLSIMLILCNCAYVEKRTYYAAVSHVAESRWEPEQGVIYQTGHPDGIEYLIENHIHLNIQAINYGQKEYFVGPCILVPLPIIPVFGWWGASMNRIKNVILHISQSSREYIVSAYIVKIDLLYDGLLIHPLTVKYSYYSQANGGSYWSNNSPLPFEINGDTMTYYTIEYDLPVSEANSFQILFNVSNKKGELILEDTLNFVKDESIRFGCAM